MRFLEVTKDGVSFRGPWAKTWKEYDPANDAIVTLASPGRKVLSREAANGAQ